MTALLLIAGLVILIVGAEWLVRGASRMAQAMGLPPLIIGLTIVSFGTSSPEVAVSIKSAYAGQSDLALGNIVGSNICNTLLILGLAALAAPLTVSRQIIRLEVPLIVVASMGVLLFARDGRVDRLDGALLLAGLVCYITFLILQGRREASAQEPGSAGSDLGMETEDSRPKPWWWNLLLTLAGLGLLVLGSNWLVTAAVTIAEALRVSELIIGLTIVAIGTSLPEIATSVMASLRGQRDIAVGNVMGSNLFNILGVLGLSGVVAPNGILAPPSALNFDIPVMIATAFACLPIFFTGNRISRWEGAVFLAYYAAYTLYLILAATKHAVLSYFSATMLYFVIPLTALTLAVVTAQAIQRHRHTSKPD